MIGDWVRIKSDIEPNDAYWLHDMQPGQALKVTEMLSNGINPDWCGGEINDYVPEDAIEPIPITPEILEKNRFVNKKGRFMQKGNFDDPPLIMWHLVDDKILKHPKSQLEIHHGYKSIHVSFVCDYVHELQHALRLCGIEKQIIL